MDFLVMTTKPANSATWSAHQRMSRWARVLEWHEYVRDLNTQGVAPWAWGLSQLVDTVQPSSVDHGLVTVYRVRDLAHLTAVLDADPLREVSDYMTVPLSTLDEDFASDTKRFEDAKKAMIGSDEMSLLRFGEYEAVTAKAPAYVGSYAPRLPENLPVDFDRRSQPGDPVELLVYGVNPYGYVELWDDMRHLMHYQKVLWWHHYTWMMVTKGIKSHVWGTNDFCAVSANGDRFRGPNRVAAGLDIFKVPTLQAFTEAFALDPIREDSQYQVALLRPIADQRAADERRARSAVGRTGISIAWPRPARTVVTI